MTEFVTFGETLLRLSPAPGERLTDARTFDAHVGGPESNAAVAAAQFGTETVWLSKLPDSPLGRRVGREVRKHGVRTGIAWADGDNTRLGTYYFERAGEPRGNAVRYDRGETAASSATADQLPLDIVKNARACYVSGVTPALSQPLRETTAAVFEAANDAGTTTAFTLQYRPKLWSAKAAREAYEEILPEVDVLIAARSDAIETLGTPEQPVKIANGLVTEYGCRTVVLTREGRGAMGLHDGEVHQARAFDTDVTDPGGSGDAFVGGFVAARLGGETLPDALSVAEAAKSVKRTTEGTMLETTEAEIERLIAEQDEPSGGR